MEKALRDPESKVRKAAADSLGNYPKSSGEIVPTLLNSLEDENLEVRGAVIIALGKLGRGSKEVEDRLREFLIDPDPATKMKAAVALTFQGTADESVIGLLAEGLGNKDATTVNSVGVALSQLMHLFPDKVAEAMGEALAKNREPLLTNTLKFVRASKTQGDAVLLGLTKAYDKAPPKVRALMLAAAVEIDKNGDTASAMAARALKDRDASLRREGLKATMRFGAKLDTFKPALVAALSDPDPENRIVAIQTVKGFSARMPEAGSRLVTIAKNDPDAGTRTAALASLGSFNDASKNVIGLLEKNASSKDERTRAASLSSLGNLAPAHSTAVAPVLERLLKTETDRKNKRIIVSGLQRAGRKTPYDREYFFEEPKVIPAGEELGGRYR